MDIAFDRGRVTEIVEPASVLDQRVQKCSVDRRGDSRFADWGSDFRQLLGKKLLRTAVLHAAGNGIQNMVDRLIGMQGEVRTRIQLDPAERISRVVGVIFSNTLRTIKIQLSIQTEATQQDVTLTQRANV